MRTFPLPSISCSPLATSAVALLALALAPAALAQTITSFDPPNCTGTVGVAINLKGQIAGNCTDNFTSPFLSQQRGFLRERDGTFTIFQPEFTINGETFGLPTFVTDLNREGEIIGFYDALGVTTSGFLRHKDGAIVEFSGGPTSNALAANAATADPCDKNASCIDGTGAFAMNARGEITGVFGDFSYNGFLRQPDGTTTDFNAGGLVTSPQAINFFGQITGFYKAAPGAGQGGFLRQPSGTIIRFDPPNSTFTMPQSINLFSEIAGYYKDANNVVHAFVRKPNGNIVTFDPPGSTGTNAVSINLEGEVTGFYFTADGKSHGFLRRANDDIETFDAPGAGSVGTFPKEINDRGEIVGYYEDGNSIIHGFVRSGHGR